jgi:DNA-binding SARP family transcriptional activator
VVLTPYRGAVGGPLWQASDAKAGDMEVAGALNCGDHIRIVLLDGFEFLSQGRRINLPQGAQRLLAYLALRDSSHRSRAAESLWPDSPPARAAANLRTALWQGRSVGATTVIECNGPRLWLSRETRIDLTEVRKYTNRLGKDSAAHGALDAVAGLGRELLPGWTEDWLILERERWDQERLHTLEQLATQLLAAEQFLPAMRTALTAIAIEPIRETAHRTVIEIHIAEGNHGNALQHYKTYRDMLDRELGVAPSQHMTQLAKRLSAW